MASEIKKDFHGMASDFASKDEHRIVSKLNGGDKSPSIHTLMTDSFWFTDLETFKIAYNMITNQLEERTKIFREENEAVCTSVEAKVTNTPVSQIGYISLMAKFTSCKRPEPKENIGMLAKTLFKKLIKESQS